MKAQRPEKHRTSGKERSRKGHDKSLAFHCRAHARALEPDLRTWQGHNGAKLGLDSRWVVGYPLNPKPGSGGPLNQDCLICGYFTVENEATRIRFLGKMAEYCTNLERTSIPEFCVGSPAVGSSSSTQTLRTSLYVPLFARMASLQIRMRCIDHVLAGFY